MTLKLDDFEPVAYIHHELDYGGKRTGESKLGGKLKPTDNAYESDPLYTASQLQQLIDQITAKDAELAAAMAEIAQWKNHHETEVRRARILKERTDMPIERVDAYEKWGEDQRELATAKAEIERLKTQPVTFPAMLDDERAKYIARQVKYEEQLAAAREEIERLKTVPMRYRRMAFNAELQDENTQLREQLAARDLVIQQKDAALQRVIVMNAYMGSLGATRQWEATCKVTDKATEALALQPSQEALDAYVEELIIAAAEYAFNASGINKGLTLSQEEVVAIREGKELE